MCLHFWGLLCKMRFISGPKRKKNISSFRSTPTVQLIVFGSILMYSLNATPVLAYLHFSSNTGTTLHHCPCFSAYAQTRNVQYVISGNKAYRSHTTRRSSSTLYAGTAGPWNSYCTALGGSDPPVRSPGVVKEPSRPLGRDGGPVQPQHP